MIPLPADCHLTVTGGRNQKGNLRKSAAPSVRRGMSIECGYEGCSPPSGGSCLRSRTHTLSWGTDMALLTEGGLCSGEIYKHCPPDGGRTRVSGNKIQSDKIKTPIQVPLLVTPV